MSWTPGNRGRYVYTITYQKKRFFSEKIGNQVTQSCSISEYVSTSDLVAAQNEMKYTDDKP
jgi:hypothetical protein